MNGLYWMFMAGFSMEIICILVCKYADWTASKIPDSFPVGIATVCGLALMLMAISGGIIKWLTST